MENNDVNTNCPPPLFTDKNHKLKKKLEEKNYSIDYDNNNYKLIISLYDDEAPERKEKIFNFQLIKSYKIEDNKKIYYESNKNLNELIKIFLINRNKCNDPIQKIFEKIEKFHSNKNVNIQKNNNSENSLDLIYTIKTLDNEEIEFKIELNKKEMIYKGENEYLLEEIDFLKNYIKNMEQKYENEIKYLKKQIKYLKDNIDKKKNKIINEEDQLICKSDLFSLNKLKIINANIDGGRGVNDYFEVYNLYNEKKSVYLAVKCKEENSEISYIDIIKISSIDNIKKIKRLNGHKQRIVFIKYFINPYTKQEYLLSGDREEIILTWEIIDENNYKFLCKITTNYGRLIMQQSIYNCILYFTENKNYIYTTTVTNNYSRLYELENGALLKDISITYYNYTFYLIRYKDFIVDCCRNNVIIYHPFNEMIYDKIECSELSGDNRSACIIYNKNNTDYLNISNSNGFIITYDLKKKYIISIINLHKDLYHIIFWDLNNLIVAQYDSEYLVNINLDNKETKELKKCSKTLMCVKKILLNGKDEILLASGENTKNIYIFYSSNSDSTVSITPMNNFNK